MARKSRSGASASTTPPRSSSSVADSDNKDVAAFDQSTYLNSYFLCALNVFVYGAVYALFSAMVIRFAEPVYGNVLSNLYVERVSVGTLLCGWIAYRAFLGATKFPNRKVLPGSADYAYNACITNAAVSSLWAALFALALPRLYALADYVAVTYSPVYGPHALYAACMYPLSLAAGFFAASAVYASAHLGITPDRYDRYMHGSRVSIPGAWFLATYAVRELLHRVHLGSFYWLLIAPLCGAALTVAGAYLFPPHAAINRKVPWTTALLTVAVVAFTFVTSPYNHLRTTSVSDVKQNFTVVDRAESVTGFLSVLDDAERDARFLRAGHSIIGGVYTYNNDSVYAGFYYHDAHRLVNRTFTPASRGLNIGYGIGVAASTFHQFNVDMDIVELDPAVIKLAQSHFKLIDSHEEEQYGLNRSRVNFYAMDGRKFLQDTTRGVYDFVIHDVFTGGTVPPELFSWEALAHIRKVLKPDGVLSLNFVGYRSSAAMQAVTKTIYAVFPYIRCFAEDAKASANERTLTNFVFFASAQPFKFRRARQSDYLNSDMRTYALANMFEGDLDLGLDAIRFLGPRPAGSPRDAPRIEYNPRPDFSKVSNEYGIPYSPAQPPNTSAKDVPIVTDAHNPLDDMMVETAVDHWNVMREVLPAQVWHNF